MRLYIVQHGEAKSEAEDPDRPLTDEGAGHVRQVAAAAQAGGLVTVDRVLHSGKTRARQAADIWGRRSASRSNREMASRRTTTRPSASAG